ncbi:MAG: GGDEF domain-containing protein [Rhodocyclales bacterium]|nr:GGDEF domain-containing protein [Rhodocyclales bacterium]
MSEVAAELARSELFRDVPAEVLQMVADHAAPLELAPGAILLAPEWPNHHVYVLLSGRLGLHFEAAESPEIRELAPGVAVGEMSIIADALPSAYVVAKEACRVFPIHRDLVQHIVDANPLARNLLRLMSQWLKANTQRIVQDRTQIWELTDRANVDALTGLYNRRWLDNALTRLLAQAAKSGQPLCVIIADVDDFKRYNDSHGHPAGDRALTAFGDVLKTTVRPYDFAARYGGEEFLVLLPNTVLAEGVAVAERIRRMAEVQRVAGADGKLLPGITVSLGLAASGAATTAESLVAAADAQLYRAKGDGRNCVRY